MEKNHLVIGSLLSALLTFNSSGHAKLLSAYGYALDTETNIVQRANDPNDKTEWLRWDLTLGMSITEALAKYGNQGWSLATENQVKKLFADIFVPGGRDGSGVLWDDFAENYQVFGDLQFDSKYEYSDGENRTLNFQNLFGYSHAGDPIPGTAFYDPVSLVSALFGDDADGDGLYNLATVRTSFTDAGGPDGSIRENPQIAFLNADTFGGSVDYSHSLAGVALTRTSLPTLDPDYQPPAPIESSSSISNEAVIDLSNNEGGLSATFDLITAPSLSDLTFNTTFTKCTWSIECAESLKSENQFFVPGDLYQSWDLDLVNGGQILNFSPDENSDVKGTVTLVFHYDDTYMTSFQEHILTIYHGHNGGWSLIDDAIIDTVENTITVTTDRFSTFTLGTTTDEINELSLQNDSNSFSSVPEPSALALMISGMLGIGLVYRRKT